ncbi:MAG: cryptochrome/photolyase family protein [Pseudomonadota bacterium]
MPTLVLVLGDQLSLDLPSLQAVDRGDAVVLMAEVMAEGQYVPHHKKKLALVLSAMRHFAVELRGGGWTVDYVTLDDPGNSHGLETELTRAIARHKPDRVVMTEPGEWRLAQAAEAWQGAMPIPLEVLEDTRFIASHAEFEDWAEGRKQLRMEYFYRQMRRKTDLLMDGDQPEGGKWNYDHDNRKAADRDLLMPKLPAFEPDEITDTVLDLIEDRFPDHPGDLRPFPYAVTRADAETAADHFFAECLASFGDYQDAMLVGEAFLYHSVLSGYINLGLLDPLALCRRAEEAYRAGDAPLNAVEGYIRQIIGWREYVRGIYWREGADYTARNHLNATRALPGFYWSGDTKMACMSATIGQTMEHAYAHHIQRLMVTGNFAMMAGIDPHAVHEWYLAVYFDAYEWVESPNVIGMSQFADGGLLASKPYAASGAYIDRMSDYCGSCHYNVKKKTGPEACPFNPLYWDFLVRNRQMLGNNPRLGPVFRTWDRMKPETQAAYRDSAEDVLAGIEDL